MGSRKALKCFLSGLAISNAKLQAELTKPESEHCINKQHLRRIIQYRVEGVDVAQEKERN